MSATRFAVPTALLVALMVAPLACAPGIPPVEQWVSASTDDGRLTAKFPAAPKTQSQTRQTVAGPLTVKMMQYETRQMAMGINQMNYPVDPAEFDAVAGLEGAVQGAAQETGSSIESVVDIEVAGFPGKEAVLVLPNGQGKARQRIVIDPSGPTMFQVIVVGEGDLINSEAANAFFENIEIK